MSRQIDTKTTKQIRIDAGWHRLLKIKAAKISKSIKELVETALAEYYYEEIKPKRKK